MNKNKFCWALTALTIVSLIISACDEVPQPALQPIPVEAFATEEFHIPTPQAPQPPLSWAFGAQDEGCASSVIGFPGNGVSNVVLGQPVIPIDVLGDTIGGEALLNNCGGFMEATVEGEIVQIDALQITDLLKRREQKREEKSEENCLKSWKSLGILALQAGIPLIGDLVNSGMQSIMIPESSLNNIIPLPGEAEYAAREFRSSLANPTWKEAFEKVRATCHGILPTSVTYPAGGRIMITLIEAFRKLN